MLCRTTKEASAVPIQASQLSDDFGHATCADGAAAFANREALAFFHGHRRDQLTSTETLSPGITISTPGGKVTVPVTSVVRK